MEEVEWKQQPRSVYSVVYLFQRGDISVLYRNGLCEGDIIRPHETGSLKTHSLTIQEWA